MGEDEDAARVPQDDTEAPLVGWRRVHRRRERRGRRGRGGGGEREEESLKAQTPPQEKEEEKQAVAGLAVGVGGEFLWIVLKNISSICGVVCANKTIKNISHLLPFALETLTGKAKGNKNILFSKVSHILSITHLPPHCPPRRFSFFL